MHTAPMYISRPSHVSHISIAFMSLPNTPEAWTPAELEQLWMLRALIQRHDAKQATAAYGGTCDYFTYFGTACMRYDTSEIRDKINRIGDPTMSNTPRDTLSVEWTADELRRLEQPAFTRFYPAPFAQDSQWCDALALHAKVARFGHPLVPTPPAEVTFPKELVQPRTGRGGRGLHPKPK